MATREPDEALVARCRGGDARAFRTLVERYQRPLYNAAYRVLGSREDARDVIQAAFMEVSQRLDGFDPRHRFFSWIYRIALNAALNVARRNRRQAELPAGELVAEGAGPDGGLVEEERARRIQAALDRLSADDRAVLTLRHFDELSYRDIAEVLGLEEKTVKSRLFEARQRLRALLAGQEAA